MAKIAAIVTLLLITLGAAWLFYLAHTVTKRKDFGQYASLAMYLSAAFLTLALAARWAASGHAPYSSQYEFAIAFAWGATIAYTYVERQFRVRTLGAFVVPVPVPSASSASFPLRKGLRWSNASIPTRSFTRR